MTPILFITCRMRAVTLRGSRRMTLLLILLLWRFTSVHSVSACNVHPVHWRLTWSCGFPRKINHTFGVFITDDGKTSRMMEKHHIRLLVEEKRRTNHHFHFLLKCPKQCFHANWRLLTFFLRTINNLGCCFYPQEIRHFAFWKQPCLCNNSRKRYDP